jgi:hypothetical protein
MSQKRYRPQEIIGRGAYPLHDLGQLLEIAQAWRADEPGRRAKGIGWTELSRVPSR